MCPNLGTVKGEYSVRRISLSIGNPQNIKSSNCQSGTIICFIKIIYQYLSSSTNNNTEGYALTLHCLDENRILELGDSLYYVYIFSLKRREK
jgi:hypothetical protein